MLLRRSFIVGALSLPATLSVGLGGMAATRFSSASGPGGRILLVADPAVPQASDFVRAWPADEASVVYPGSGGHLSLYERLKALWRREGSAPIAGLTTARMFFWLSHTAADHGLRLIHRHVHDAAAGAVRNSPALAAAQTRLVLATYQGGPGSRTFLSIPEFLPHEAITPVSWLMIPRRQIAPHKL